jgi:hypothetical protein
MRSPERPQAQTETPLLSLARESRDLRSSSADKAVRKRIHRREMIRRF